MFAYSISEVQAFNPSIRLAFAVVLLLLGTWYYFWFRNKVEVVKLRLIVFFLCLWGMASFLSSFTSQNLNGQLTELKHAYTNKNFESISGELLLGEEYVDGIDVFFINGTEFRRYNPNKQVPKFGCWKGFLSNKKGIERRNVNMKFVMFEKWLPPSRRTGSEHLDQVCILEIEID